MVRDQRDDVHRRADIGRFGVGGGSGVTPPDGSRPILARKHHRGVMVSPRRLLLVETDPPLRRLIEQVASPISAITVTADFPAGRAALISGQFDLVVANVRLRAYNGLHLLYLAKAASLPTRTILYSDPVDPFLVSEAHRAGGFYESMARLPYSLPAYIRAELPPVDRRDPMTPDRRLTFRGGRRCSDVPLSAPRPAWT